MINQSIPKFYKVLLLILGISRISYAQNIDKNLQVSFSAGRQEENFHWSIAGNQSGQNPNILSELKWKGVTGTFINASLQWNAWRRFVIYADYSRTNVHSGNVSDADYAGDNRTEQTYDETFDDNKGYSAAANAGLGYRFFNTPVFSLTPIVGYTYSTQQFYIVDLSNRFPGLNSSYQSYWKGAFLKVRSSIRIWQGLKFLADVTYSQAGYSANGDWNLISEFQHPVSYTHQANGYGISAGGRLVYQIIPNLSAGLNYNYFNWQTGNGNDVLYKVNHEVDRTQMNGVMRNGYNFSLSVVVAL